MQGITHPLGFDGQIVKISNALSHSFHIHRASTERDLEREACLAAASAIPRNIMSATHYVVNYDSDDTTRQELWAEFLGRAAPPGTLVPVEKLARPGLSFEIEVMAVVEVDEKD